MKPKPKIKKVKPINEENDYIHDYGPLIVLWPVIFPMMLFIKWWIKIGGKLLDKVGNF